MHDQSEELAAAREEGIAALAERILADDAPIYIQHEFDDRLLADLSGKLRRELRSFDAGSCAKTQAREAVLAIRYLRRNLASEVARERYDCYLDMCQQHALDLESPDSVQWT